MLVIYSEKKITIKTVKAAKKIEISHNFHPIQVLKSSVEIRGNKKKHLFCHC